MEVFGKCKEDFFEELGAESGRRSLVREHKSFITNSDPQSFFKESRHNINFIMIQDIENMQKPAQLLE